MFDTKGRAYVYGLQCKLCGCDIEMDSFIVFNSEKVQEEIAHLDCYIERLNEEIMGEGNETI